MRHLSSRGPAAAARLCSGLNMVNAKRASRRTTVHVKANAPVFQGYENSSSTTLERPKSKVAVPVAPLPPPPAPQPSLSQSAAETSSTATSAVTAAIPHAALDGSPQLFPQPGTPQWPPRRPFAAVALDQLMESVGDVGRHWHRMVMEPECLIKKQKEQLVPVVLVLGSGWGAHSLIKVIDTDMYDVIVVSPRNHFVFTPMLPSTAVGTVEFRSLLEPIRTSNPCITYLEAECNSIDPEGKLAICTSQFAFDDGRRPEFEIQYDRAVVAIGEQPATFGVPGVREHCFFMKEVTDAVALRKRIAEKFELACLPGTSEPEKHAALHFVIVGGGPTGVEFAGTFSDFLREDLKKKYPALMRYVKVTLLQSVSSLLTQFDERLQRNALATLTSVGVQVRTNVRVVGVTQDKVILHGGEELTYGVCLWSAGNAPRPLVKQIASKVPQQAMAAAASKMAPGSKLCVDSFLRVVGSKDLLALGNCSLVLGNRLPPTAQVAGQQGAYLAHLLNSGVDPGEGGYTRPPPFHVVKGNRLQKATDHIPFLRWLATAIAGGRDRIETGATVVDALFRMDAPPWVRSHSEALTAAPPLDQPSRATLCDIRALREAAAAAGGATPEAIARAMQECMRSFDEEQRAARDAAEAFEVRYWDRPFEFLSLGIMAYVGNEKALTQVEAFDIIHLRITGTLAFALWKSVYITKQVSLRNRILILFDWMKARVFGRDISLF